MLGFLAGSLLTPFMKLKLAQNGTFLVLIDQIIQDSNQPNPCRKFIFYSTHTLKLDNINYYG